MRENAKVVELTNIFSYQLLLLQEYLYAASFCLLLKPRLLSEIYLQVNA